MSDSSKSSSKISDRRREQNRIAQRNHRSRVREQQQESQCGKSPPLDAAQSAHTRTNSFSDFTFRTSPPSPVYDMPALSPNAWRKWQSTSHCTCNSLSGPCENHVQQLRTENTFQYQMPLGEFDLGLGYFDDINNTAFPKLPQHPFITTIEPDLTGPKTFSPLPNRTVMPKPPTPSLESRASSSSTNSNTFSNISEGESSFLTQKFDEILDLVHQCDFASFDEAVTAYYTHAFEDGTRMKAAQSTSRGRHLGRTLGTINAASKRWTKWEVRGLQENIIEAAEGIYESEARLARSEARQSESGAFSSLPLASNIRELMNVAQDNNPQLDFQAQSLSQELSAFQDTCQNKIPNLWALFSTLVGQNNATRSMPVLVAISLLLQSNEIGQVSAKLPTMEKAHDMT